LASGDGRTPPANCSGKFLTLHRRYAHVPQPATTLRRSCARLPNSRNSSGRRASYSTGVSLMAARHRAPLYRADSRRLDHTCGLICHVFRCYNPDTHRTC
jgi:hypothetical protein